ILANIRSTMHKGIFFNKKQEYEQIDLENIEHFIGSNPAISAIICSEFEIAVLLNKVLGKTGKRIPEDISIICFDSPPNYIHPPLFTNIQQDQRMMGFKAVELLHEQLAGN
ncbi:substrate-binding domain-containing protein, partial [Alkalihalophilus pseudofirmus]